MRIVHFAGVRSLYRFLISGLGDIYCDGFKRTSSDANLDFQQRRYSHRKQYRNCNI